MHKYSRKLQKNVRVCVLPPPTLVPGDGKCLFNALAVLLYTVTWGKQQSCATELPSSCWLLLNSKLYTTFVWSRHNYTCSTVSITCLHRAPITRLSFHTIESSMYKRRRLAQPALPGSPEDVDSVLLSTRFTNLNGAPFYRGLSDPDDSRSSSTFSSREQLELLKEANHISMPLCIRNKFF